MRKRLLAAATVFTGFVGTFREGRGEEETLNFGEKD